MHHLIPDFILQNDAAGESSGQLQAAVLFVDIAGFSTLTDTLMQHRAHGAEVLATIMRAIFGPCVQQVYAYGGFIAHFAGDAFTAIFSDDEETNGRFASTTPLRALAAAHAMQQDVAAHTQQHTPYGDFSISAKIGLAFGDVQWGIVTSADSQRASFYFQGTGIDEASVAEHHAHAGEIILSSSMYKVATSYVRVESIDEHYRILKITDNLPVPQSITLPPIALEQAARFFPQIVLDTTISGEFRQVVNMFISLPTVRTETQLRIFMQTLFNLQAQYNGFLNRLDFGDKGTNVLLFWGAPVAYENDIPRALDFILTLQAQTAIPINGGLTYRDAHAGHIGSSLAEEYTCYGRGVNLAARFMTTAPRGEIWVDENVYHHAAAEFDLKFVGEKTFKGFVEPQKVYQLIERKVEHTIGYEGNLVGREVEIQTLTEFVQPLFSGSDAGMLVVYGEPGIGKSRLVHEFVNLASISEKCQIFVAQTDQILRESLNPFRYWLKRYFGVSDIQVETRNKRSFNRKLDELVARTPDSHLANELDRTRTFLGALVGLEWPDSLYEQLDAKGRFENTLIGLTTLLQAESQQQPIMLILEDVHWLDDDSQSYLVRLMHTLHAEPGKRYPIAILATAREEGQMFLPEGIAYRQIHLGQLTKPGLSALAESLLQGAAAPTLLDMLWKRAEGNPFFAEQILRFLLEENLLTQSDGTWHIADTHTDTSLPTTIHAVLIARLDRLTQEVKAVVQTAAVLGREFEVRLLAQMLRADTALSQEVANAEQAAIWDVVSELHYIFKHALLRDAAYEMQVHTRRAELHQLAATALETLYADDLAAHYGEIAYHYEAAFRAGLAELSPQARMYLKQAGQRAADNYENAEAIDYFTRALALTPDDDLTTRYDLLLAREKLYDARGQRELERQDLLQLEQLANALDHDGRRAEIDLRWANHYEETGQFQAGIDAANRALALTQAIGNVEQQTYAMYLQASLFYRLGDYSVAIAICEEGLVLARDHKLDLRKADLLIVLSFSLDVQGESAKALGELQQAFAVYQSAKDLNGEMATLNSIAIAEYGLERYADASAHFDEAIELARKTGRRKAEARYTGNIGQLVIALGDLQKAQSYLERALFLNREIGNLDSVGINLGNLGVVATKFGDFARAQEFFQQAVTIANEVKDTLLVCEILAYWSLLDIQRGDYAMALVRGQESLPTAKELGSRVHEGLILMSLGHALVGLERWDEAVSCYEDSMAVQQSLGKTVGVMEARAGLARVALARGDAVQAVIHIQTITRHLFPTLDDEDATHNLSGAEAPLWVWLTWYQVWCTANDPRATDVLMRAYTILLAETIRLVDADAQWMYVENIPYRREIAAAYAQHFGKDPRMLRQSTHEV